jgi:nicotinate-nucleotide pyrophosphorylase (carboxylating)
MDRFNWDTIDQIVKLALVEDLDAGGDITTQALLGLKSHPVEAEIQVKEEGLLAGLPIAQRVFEKVDKKIKFFPCKSDGERLMVGDIIARLEGEAASILKGERTALNFLQHLSGIATLTNQFVEKIRPFKAALLDTRKTLPGLRWLEKYAVRVGGGMNHRFGLYDEILIKDNHLKVVGSLKESLARAKEQFPEKIREVEVESLSELKEALEAGAEKILLDNMEVKSLKKAVEINNGRALLEASGGISLDNVEEIAATGVDFISVGQITLGAKPLNISLEIIGSKLG